MSLCNFFLTPNRALVAVDTDSYFLGNGSRDERSKMLVLPHLNAVLTGTGLLDFVAFIFTQIHSDGGTFDEVAARMPAMMDTAQNALFHRHPDFRENFTGQRIFWFGPSSERGRLVAWVFERKVPTQPVEATEWPIPHPGCACPWDYQISLPVLPDSDENMLILARAQLERFRGTHGLGGRLLVAEILTKPRPTLTVRDVGKLDLGPTAA